MVEPITIKVTLSAQAIADECRLLGVGRFPTPHEAEQIAVVLHHRLHDHAREHLRNLLVGIRDGSQEEGKAR